ncbi:MAG: glycosyltransferase 61 family protein, partial [Gemmatimonadota bacterium]
RHESLIPRRAEPARLDLRPIGIADAAPLVLATEYLARARALAVAAVEQSPVDAEAHYALAECALRSGFPLEARRAAERAVACGATTGALVARALATFADHREQVALDDLRQPQLTELIPELGTGQHLAIRVDPAGSPDEPFRDPARLPWRLPYVVQHAGVEHARSVTVHTGPSSVRVIPGGRVVGDLFFAIDRADVGYVHGVVDEPDVQFGTPRCHDFPGLIERGRNCVLWATRDRRLLLHSPAGERLRGGRAFLLASNGSASYYHWLADALGRLSAMPDVLLDPDMRFVVPAPLQPFQVETLAWLGITLDRVVQVAPDEILEFDELLVVAHRKDGGCTDAGVWRWLSDHLRIPAMSACPTPARRLFLPGAATGPRHLLNLAEAEAICAAQGFESVDTSALSVAERRDLFSDVAVVVAPVGAHVADLLFAPAGARTILFGQQSYVVPCYNALAAATGHSMRYVLGVEEPSRFVYPHWDYRINSGDLRAALQAELS